MCGLSVSYIHRQRVIEQLSQNFQGYTTQVWASIDMDLGNVHGFQMSIIQLELLSINQIFEPWTTSRLVKSFYLSVTIFASNKLEF